MDAKPNFVYCDVGDIPTREPHIRESFCGIAVLSAATPFSSRIRLRGGLASESMRLSGKVRESEDHTTFENAGEEGMGNAQRGFQEARALTSWRQTRGVMDAF